MRLNDRLRLSRGPLGEKNCAVHYARAAGPPSKHAGTPAPLRQGERGFYRFLEFWNWYFWSLRK